MDTRRMLVVESIHFSTPLGSTGIAGGATAWPRTRWVLELESRLLRGRLTSAACLRRSLAEDVFNVKLYVVRRPLKPRFSGLGERKEGRLDELLGGVVVTGAIADANCARALLYWELIGFVVPGCCVRAGGVGVLTS